MFATVVVENILKRLLKMFLSHIIVKRIPCIHFMHIYITDNLATNGIATQSPSNKNHPAYLSVNGNRTGMCSMTSGSNSYLQVNTGYNSIITMIYITFGGKLVEIYE